MADDKFLQLVRAAIAVKEIAKKDLARKCDINRTDFSLMIHGDKAMPDHVVNFLTFKSDALSELLTG